MKPDPPTYPVMCSLACYEILLRPTQGEMLDFIIKDMPTHELLLGVIEHTQGNWSKGRPFVVGDPHTLVQGPDGRLNWQACKDGKQQAAPSFDVYRDMLRVANFSLVKRRERVVLHCCYGGVKIGDVIIKPTVIFETPHRLAVCPIHGESGGHQGDGFTDELATPDQ